MKRISFTLLSLFITVGLLSGCGTSEAANSNGEDDIVIGYFPNINHSPEMVARKKGFFEKSLGDKVNIEYKTFPDGSAFMMALKTGEIDAGLVGPGPAMNNYTNGADVKIIAAGSTGGTVVIARKGSGIESIEDISGKTFITPRVGCTHDVQFETYIEAFNMASNRIGGEVKHVTGNPAQYELMFKQGKVDIAVAPEPWASVLEEKVGGKVLVANEISFGETLPASVLVTSGKLIKEDNELIQKIVDAHVKAIEFIKKNPEEAKQITIDSIKQITGQELSKPVIDRAWKRIGFTYKVNQEALQKFGTSSYNLKLLKEEPEFTELVDTEFIQ